jgi:hypothetical protein
MACWTPLQFLLLVHTDREASGLHFQAHFSCSKHLFLSVFLLLNWCVLFLYFNFFSIVMPFFVLKPLWGNTFYLLHSSFSFPCRVSDSSSTRIQILRSCTYAVQSSSTRVIGVYTDDLIQLRKTQTQTKRLFICMSYLKFLQTFELIFWKGDEDLYSIKY